MTTQQKFKNMKEVIKANKAAGYHFFDADTMRYFNTKIESELIENKYFITSERYREEPKGFTIREVKEGGQVETVGTFHDYKSLNEAKNALVGIINAIDHIKIDKKTIVALCDADQKVIEKDNQTEDINNIFKNMNDSNSWVRRFFRCWLDGSYNGHEQYKRLLEKFTKIINNNQKMLLDREVRVQLYHFLVGENEEIDKTIIKGIINNLDIQPFIDDVAEFVEEHKEV